MHQESISLFVDQFEGLIYQTPEIMKKTMWFGPIDPSWASMCKNDYLKSFFHPKEVGTIRLPLRYKQGKKVGVKSSATSNYIFVEFDDEKSVK